MYFLGVENGLARTRGVVLNLDSASIEAEGEVKHEFVDGLPSGHREQDPSQWVRATDEVVRGCLARLGEERRRVVGIGVAGHPRSPVLLDRDNRIIRAAKVGGDRSTGRQRTELARLFGGSPGLVELTGNSMRAGSVAAKLLWFKQNEPHLYQRLSMVMMPHDFINYWLTGVKRTEFSEAAQTGLLDVRRREWCRPLLEAIDPGLLAVLPPVKSSRESHGPLRPELARKWGLSEDIPVSAGGSLAVMAAMGAGSVKRGSVTMTLAPQATVAVVCEEPLVDPWAEIGTACDVTDRWLAHSKRVRTGNGLEEARSHYGWTVSELREAMFAAKDGAGGLLLLPGSKREGHAGVLYGMDGKNFRRENVARAALEALLMELGGALARMKDLGVEPETIRLTGGGSADPEVRRLVADVMGVPVLPLRGEVSPAMGAALQAAWTFFHQSGEDLTFEEITSYAVAPEEGQRCDPNRERYRFYQELLKRQEALMETVQGEQWPKGVHG